MISFATLCFGLVYGVLNVEIRASDDVARVDLVLDGGPVAELRAPFAAPVDLGWQPAPHELVAVGYDERGKELGRARQWINRPRGNVEIRLVVEPAGTQRSRIARLTWNCPTSGVVGPFEVTLDGRRLPASDPSRIEIPVRDAGRTQILRASVACDGNVNAIAETLVGGTRPSTESPALTAVPVTLEKGTKLPSPDGLVGWLEKDGAGLRVAAVEEGGFDVVFVCEGGAFERLQRLLKRPGAPDLESAENDFRLLKRRAPDLEPSEDGLRFRFLVPVGRAIDDPTVDASAYAATAWFQRRWDAIGPTLTKGLELKPWPRTEQRIADAVAAAGLAAAGRERRRAVVLLLGPDARDEGDLNPSEARRFLIDLRVPIFVWSIGKAPSPETGTWDATSTITTAAQFDVAVTRLRAELRRQRILWVEGAHLPQAVTLTPLAKGVRLAR